MARETSPAPPARPTVARTSLTPSGRGALFVGALLAAGGWAAGYPEPAVAGVCVLLAVAASALWTLPRPGVTAERRLRPPHSERGGGVTATVLVRRTHKGRIRGGLRLVDRCGDEVLDRALRLPPEGHLGALEYPIPTPVRGRVPMGPLLITVADPFGLCRRVHPCGGDEFLLVRPKTAPLQAASPGREPTLDGVTSDAVHGATAAFHALREYVPGDDRRMVHWRSTARTGSLKVRQMADVSLPRLTVVLDTDPGHYAGTGIRALVRGQSADAPDDFELAVDVCASIAAAAARGHFPVSVVTDTGPLLRGIDNAAPDVLLDALALTRPGGSGALEQTLRKLGRTPSGGTLVVVLGGATPAPAYAVLARTLTAFQRVVVLRVARERAAPPSGLRVVDVAGLNELPAAWRRVSAP